MITKRKYLRGGAVLESAPALIIRERLGAMARGARAALGFELQEVAQALGVSATELSGFELARNGQGWLVEDKVRALAELLRCPPLLDELSRLPSIADRRARMDHIEKLEERGLARPGELVWLRRMRMNITRKELSIRSGVPTKTLERMELHNGQPRRSTLYKLEPVLGDGLDNARAIDIRRRYRNKRAPRRKILNSIPLENRSLAQRVELARLEAGLSRAAAELRSGYSTWTWDDIESGKTAHPWRSTIEVFAETLNDASILAAWKPPPWPVTTLLTGGDRLRHARIAAGLTRQMAADRFSCCKTSVARWESGKRQPRGRQLKKVVEVLGFNPWTPQGQE